MSFALRGLDFIYICILLPDTPCHSALPIHSFIRLFIQKWERERERETRYNKNFRYFASFYFIFFVLWQRKKNPPIHWLTPCSEKLKLTWPKRKNMTHTHTPEHQHKNFFLHTYIHTYITTLPASLLNTPFFGKGGHDSYDEVIVVSYISFFYFVIRSFLWKFRNLNSSCWCIYCSYIQYKYKYRKGLIILKECR